MNKRHIQLIALSLLLPKVSVVRLSRGVNPKISGAVGVMPKEMLTSKESFESPKLSFT
jgi:hypothetical protein